MSQPSVSAESKTNKKKKKKETEEDRKAKAELELLMIPEHEEEERKGYNLSSLLKEEKKKKKQKDRKGQESGETFKVDITDPRFEKMFSDPYDYGIDPTNPNFNDTEGMRALLKERVKRRAKAEKVADGTSSSSQLQSLVNSVKAKTLGHRALKRTKTEQ